MDIIKYFQSITFRGKNKDIVYSQIETFSELYNVKPILIKFDKDYQDQFGSYKAYVKFTEGDGL